MACCQGCLRYAATKYGLTKLRWPRTEGHTLCTFPEKEEVQRWLKGEIIPLFKEGKWTFLEENSRRVCGSVEIITQ